MTKREQRTYDPEFKKEAVLLVTERNRKPSEVAHDLGIPTDTLYGWIKAYRHHPEESFPGKGKLRSEDAELLKLEKRIRDLEEENEILKKATAIFAQLPRKNTHS
jgi:transposase